MKRETSPFSESRLVLTITASYSNSIIPYLDYIGPEKVQHSLSLGAAGPLDHCSGHPHLAPLDESFGSAASWRWRRSSKGFRADISGLKNDGIWGRKLPAASGP